MGEWKEEGKRKSEAGRQARGRDGMRGGTKGEQAMRRSSLSKRDKDV